MLTSSDSLTNQPTLPTTNHYFQVLARLKSGIKSGNYPSVGQICTTPGVHNPIEIHQICHEYMIHGRRIIQQQFPITPSWATTIHKCQSATLDQIVAHLGDTIFEHGMAYVAIS